MLQQQGEVDMDRISDIPDPIAHHIMSLLTNIDVTKLSILSKRFLFLWGSFPVIEFDVTNFSGSIPGRYSISMVNRFLDHILNSLNLRRLSSSYILSEFRVNVYPYNIKADDRFDEAISIVNENGVKMIDLNLGYSEYKLPDTFSSKWCNVLRLQGFQLDLCKLIRTCPLLRTICLTDCIILKDIKVSSRTLNDVEISRCKVNCITINAPKLQSFTFNSGYRTFQLGYRSEPCLIDVSKCQEMTYLSLNNVVNGKEWIEEHVYTLRKLRTLILNACRDVQQIRVSSETLKRLEIIDCPLSSTTIESSSLEHFVYKGAISNSVCINKFGNTKCIKDMSLEGAFVTDEWLESVIAILSCLERLRLHGCNQLNEIRVYHEKLKSFELTKCIGLKEADIDTPKLESFVYQG
ncbi:F-box/FBD/LRR-repeat protein At5g56420-like [Rutidosis leptorrhynchoides]|uniref:F-box/FBD/LRR-repeat protein At5g56420-like n=1 Tax=Rutidosis leptorrhynchoides TaxID=125765 RepID=UPI003A99DE8B